MSVYRHGLLLLSTVIATATAGPAAADGIFHLVEPVAQAPDGTQPDVVVPVPPLAADLNDIEQLRTYARDAKAAGDLPKAEEALRRILQQQPGDYAATVELARILIQAQRNSDAQGFLEGAVPNFTADPQLSSLLGQTYFNNEFNCQAIQWLEYAACLDPCTPDVYFYLGSAYLKERLPIQAYRTLSMLGPVSDPQIAAAQKLARGSALGGVRLFGEAMTLYQEVEQEYAGTAMGDRARQMQCQLHDTICSAPRFRGTVKLSQRYDSFPGVIPATNVIGTPLLVRQPSWGNLAYANASYDVYRGYNDDVTIGSSTLNTVNYDFDEGNLNDLGVFGVYNHRGLWGDTPYTAGVVTDWDYLLVDSDGYLHRTGVTPFYTLQHDDFRTTSLFCRYTSLDFINPAFGGVNDPDADNIAPGFTYTRSNCARNAAITGGYVYDWNDADSDLYNYNGHRLLMGVTWLTPCNDLRLNFSSSLYFRDYIDSEPFLGFGRQDTQTILQAAAIYPLTRCNDWFLVLEYFHDRNFSDLDTADYSRHTVDIGIQYNFGQPGVLPARTYYDTTYRQQ